MKAFVYHGIGKKTLEDRPKPELASPTDAIVKITKTTICGTDLHILKGDLPSCQPGRILGHEGVGIIDSVGSAVQDFNGFLKVLNPKLGVSDHCAVLLYQCGEDGASYKELETWVRPPMRKNLKRALDALVNEKDHAHFDGIRYLITRVGEQYVEQKNLITPAQLIK